MLKKVILLLILVPIASLIPAGKFLYPQSHYQDVSIEYDDNLISIFANEADLKNVLFMLADKANIYVNFPESLENKITIREEKITLKSALKIILKGFNYVLIYSGPSKKLSKVEAVYVYMKSKKTNNNYSRILNQLNSLETLLVNYKLKLNEVDENSVEGKRYLMRIKSVEKNIERLENQLN